MGRVSPLPPPPPAAPATLADFHWLVSDKAAPWLERAAAAERSLVTLTARLRRELTLPRVHLVLEQRELRRRAAEKFSHAADMYFTRQLLEQATDERIAAYKATRFPGSQPVADLCCGLGGDLIALAGRGPAIGLDRDEVAALLARGNCGVYGRSDAAVRVADAADAAIADMAAWHLDPDRRALGGRTTRLEGYEPGPAVVERLRRRQPSGAIKLAPATDTPDDWSAAAEREWIGSRGECRQQVVWFGTTARYPGERSATIVDAGGAGVPVTVHGGADVIAPAAAGVGRYVFEPHAAIRAAHLAGVLAGKQGLHAIAPDAGYLTGDQPRETPALACFEVLERLPFDLKRVRSLLRERGIGRLEIKKRGVDVLPEKLLPQLRLRGDEAAVLLLTPHRRSTIAILARRYLARTS